MRTESELVIVHEQLSEFGGVERVLEAVAGAFPCAPILGIAFERRVHPRLEALRNPILAYETDEPRNQFDLRRWAEVTAESFQVPPAELTLHLTQCGWSLAADVSRSRKSVAYMSGLSRPYFYDTENYLSALEPDRAATARSQLSSTRDLYMQLIHGAREIWTVSTWSRENLSSQTGRSARVVSPYHPLICPAGAGQSQFLGAKTGPRVVSVGRVVKHKRLDLVVDAARLTGLDTVVIGEGPCLSQLRAVAPPNVSLVGAVPDEDLVATLGDADVLVCPSVEEYGLVVVEALAQGTPVLVPREGAAVELIEEGVTGAFFDPSDARSLASLLNGLDACSFDDRACRSFARAQSTTNLVAELRNVLGSDAT